MWQIIELIFYPFQFMSFFHKACIVVSQLILTDFRLLFPQPEDLKTKITKKSLFQKVCIRFEIRSGIYNPKYFQYRTPSVNQYWAIVNASLPYNKICSLSRLKFASFKSTFTAQKTR